MYLASDISFLTLLSSLVYGEVLRNEFLILGLKAGQFLEKESAMFFV